MRAQELIDYLSAVDRTTIVVVSIYSSDCKVLRAIDDVHSIRLGIDREGNTIVEIRSCADDDFFS